jgi:hypothetical protein
MRKIHQFAEFVCTSVILVLMAILALLVIALIIENLIPNATVWWGTMMIITPSVKNVFSNAILVPLSQIA